MLLPACRYAAVFSTIASADSNVHSWTCKCCFLAELDSRRPARNQQHTRFDWLAQSHTPACAKHTINLPQSPHACIWMCKSTCTHSTNSPWLCCTSWSITRGTPACCPPTPPTTAAAVPHPTATPANPRPHCLIDITGVRAGQGAATRQSRGSGPVCASTSTRDQHCSSVSTNHCYASCTRYSCVSLLCSSA